MTREQAKRLVTYFSNNLSETFYSLDEIEGFWVAEFATEECEAYFIEGILKLLGILPVVEKKVDETIGDYYCITFKEKIDD